MAPPATHHLQPHHAFLTTSQCFEARNKYLDPLRVLGRMFLVVHDARSRENDLPEPGTARLMGDQSSDAARVPAHHTRLHLAFCSNSPLA